ncbi:MAG: MFS transporter [Lysobacter sp.]
MARARRRIGEVIGAVPDWAPHERPMIPGSPSTPDMPPTRRLAYGLTGLLLGTTGGMGTAIVSTNLSALQGAFGLDVREGAWLAGVYAMFNISMNLLLIKYRQQFGLTSFAKLFLAIYAAASVAHLFIDTYAAALVVRAISGIAGAAMGGLAVMYMSQALPPTQTFKFPALLLGLGCSQVAGPICWIISPDLLALGGWRSIYVLQAGLAVACLAAAQLLRPPPGIRVQAFEWRDAISFVLLAPSLGLLVAVASLGRIDWWLEAPWIGWALATCVILFVGAMLFEHHREHPLIDTRWVFSLGFLNFGLSIMLVRVLLTEQPFGAAGLLQVVGMGLEQTRTLYTVVLIATIAGLLVGAFSLALSKKLVPVQLLLALVLISVAAFMDSAATGDTHPAELYLSQGLMGFASALFLGSAFALGLGQLLARGLQSVITFAMMFGITQALGGAAGGAALATFQAMRVQHHAAYLAEGVVASDPATSLVLQSYGGAYASSIADPALGPAQGVSTLAQQVIQQANILAFNDVFYLIGWGALALLAFNIAMLVNMAIKSRSTAATNEGAMGTVAI